MDILGKGMIINISLILEIAEQSNRRKKNKL